MYPVLVHIEHGSGHCVEDSLRCVGWTILVVCESGHVDRLSLSQLCCMLEPMEFRFHHQREGIQVFKKKGLDHGMCRWRLWINALFGHYRHSSHVSAHPQKCMCLGWWSLGAIPISIAIIATNNIAIAIVITTPIPIPKAGFDVLLGAILSQVIHVHMQHCFWSVIYRSPTFGPWLHWKFVSRV